MIQCIKCGCCCKVAGHIPDFPEPTVDGVCVHLKDNECSIYDRRPDICNSRKVYEQQFSHITESKYIHDNRVACITLMNIFNIPVPENF